MTNASDKEDHKGVQNHDKNEQGSEEQIDSLLKQLGEYEPFNALFLESDEDIAALTRLTEEANTLDLSSLLPDLEMPELLTQLSTTDWEPLSTECSGEELAELLNQITFSDTDWESLSTECSGEELTELLNQVIFNDSNLPQGVALDAKMPTVHPNANPSDIAMWMKSEIDLRNVLYQEWAANRIRHFFGQKFVYRNKNKNLAISREVLAEFLRLTNDYVVWNKSKRFWRIRRSDDPKARSVTS
jgi:hypothetical protein